jgi:hypothetical protein
MADGDSYSWIGGTAGTWDNAANWEDLTTGTVAAVAPGINNDATIGAGVTVYGTGSAATLTALDQEGPLPAPVTLAGDLNVGTLVSDGYLSVTGTLTGDDITIGQVMTGPGYFLSDSVLYGDGTIEAAPGGTITLFADSSGTNTFQLDGNATILALPNVFPGLGGGVSIVLSGTNNAIEIASTYEGQPNLFGTILPTISTSIQGFNPTDQIDFEDTAFRVAAFSDGTLTLTGNFAPQTLYFAGDYTGDSFRVSGGTVTVIPDALLPHSYSWIGGSAGVWNNAANWQDLTAGTVAAAAPGIANAATIAGSVALSGNASAASLTVLGDETVFGTINTGTLVLAGGASISALDGATIDAGGITISPNIVSEITVDAALVIEIGNSATGVAGALTIDPGNTLSGAATLAANVVDNGLIVGAPVTFDNGLIAGLPVMIYTDDSLSGTGTIEVPANGAMAIGETAANAGLTFQVDGNALLVLDAPIAAGNTIDLLGNGNTISTPVGQPAVGATIGGFNSSDAIYVSAETFPGNIYGDDYASAFYFNNTLTLTAPQLDAAPLVYTLYIPGNYASDAFQLTSNGLGQDVTLSPTATNTDSYSWIGGTAGAWGNPSNWEDLTTGALAGIAPGIDNDATIGVGVTVYGNGSAASLTTSSAGDEGDTIAGDLNAGTWVGGAFLTLDSGTISASDITIGGVSPLPFGTPQAPVFGLAFGFQGTGTIEVLAGGTVNLYEALLGSGTTFQLDGDTTMVALGSIVGGNTIVMDGSDNTLDISDVYNGATNYYNPGPPPIGATIEGFNTTDVIVTDWIGDAPTAVAYANGTLTLSGPDGTNALFLAGDYSADTFEINNGTVTAVPTASLPLSYSWIGGTAGTWGNAANWEDLRAGTVAASAPGIDNPATIDGTVTVSGTGSAASLTILGNETVLDNLNAGTLVVGGTGGLTINAGATVSAADATDSGAIVVAGTSADLSVSGVLQIDQTALTVYDGGLVQVENVVLQGTSIVGTWVDPGAGDFHRLGETVPPPEVALIIGSGGTVSGTGALYIQKTAVQRSPGYGIVNNGVISSGALQIGQVLQLHYTGILPGPRGTPGTSVVWDQTPLGATLSGTGSVEVLTGGTINVVATVTGSETFLLDGTANLNLYGSVAAGSTILMDGGSDTINVSNFFDGINVGGTYSYNGVPSGELGSPTPPPAVSATIFGFDATDQIVFQGIYFTVASYADGTLNLLQDTTSVGSLTLSGDYSDDIFSVTGTTVAGQAQEVVTVSPACFAAGTRIATPRGEIPVESLRQGDEVTLASGGTAPIVWIGRRRVDCRSHPKPRDVWPVRIRHSAFAPGIPCRDLFLSPDHAVFAEEVLIPIKHLMNGDTIQQAPCETVDYFHLELPAHDLVLADGMAVESYLDTGDRSSFENAGRVITLFPEFSSLKWEAYGYAPLVVTGPPVEAARRRIEIQARRQDSAPRRQRRRKTS